VKVLSEVWLISLLNLEIDSVRCKIRELGKTVILGEKSPFPCENGL
jgi:hypothetical protein